jgi:tetratricopeptide (TPR) repeat protein
MPNVASSNIAHTAITDHRIFRTPGVEGRDAGSKKTESQEYPIVPFDRSGNDVSSPEKERDLGVALIEFASKQPSQEWGRLAMPLLDRGLSRWPDDIPALEAKGYALMIQGRDQEARDAFEGVLGRAPEREKSLFGAALLAARIGRNDLAVKYWTKAIDMNPWNWEYHDELAKVYGDLREWKSAAEQCQDALKLNLAAWETRKLLVRALLRQGEKDEAKKELSIMLGFEPPDPEALRRWFEDEGRGR